MQKNKSVQLITQASMMIALSVIIGIFCKTFLNFGAGLWRITFENVPILMSGIVMGPLVGGVVGLSSDLLSYFLSAQAYPPNLVVTLGAALVGIISGLVSKFLIKNYIEFVIDEYIAFAKQTYSKKPLKIAHI